MSAKLEALIDEFAELEPRERLELLLEFSEKLPALPPKYQAEKAAGEHRVHECQTPVFIWVEVHDGKLAIFGDVAPESPTVKGFVSIFIDAFHGTPPEELLAVKPEVLQRMGLAPILGMVRARGLHAILHYLNKSTQRAVAASSS